MNILLPACPHEAPIACTQRSTTRPQILVITAHPNDASEKINIDKMNNARRNR